MIYILTGAIGSGKTTRLEKWAEKEKSISGILMPVLDGERHLYSISSGKLVPVEIRGDESPDEIVRIGKFNFSKKIFNWGIDEILKGFRESNTIIVDEIGPLELSGEGFAPAIKQIFKSKTKILEKRIIFVIREGMVEQVMDHFNISKYLILSSLTELKTINKKAVP